jgi:hypothetical protein
MHSKSCRDRGVRNGPGIALPKSFQGQCAPAGSRGCLPMPEHRDGLTHFLPVNEFARQAAPEPRVLTDDLRRG